MKFTAKHALFIFLFGLLAIIADQFKFSAVWGASGQYFTAFNFFAPIAGAFLGPVFGAISVVLAQAGNYLLAGKAFDIVNVLRILPMIFAAYYFGTKNKTIVIIPLACIALFLLHPVGGQAWFFPLFWLLPLVMLFNDSPFAKAIGATFTAHAIGSVVWLYFVNAMDPAAWTALVPVVLFERGAFAIGICLSYYAFNAILSRLPTKFTNLLNIDPTQPLAVRKC